MLTSQPEALQRMHILVAVAARQSDWSRNCRAVLTALIQGMDWTSGLACGVTAERMAQRAGCSDRTVTRVLAWAQQNRLLVVVEGGATKEFLGTDTNRCPSYALVTPRRDPIATAAAASVQANGPQQQIGDPPGSSVDNDPLPRCSQGPNPSSNQQTQNWPGWRIPTTASERAAAATTLLTRIGWDKRRAASWRLHGLLFGWWQQGVCVMGLLYMLEHHPDRPNQSRGDALRGARSPLAVLGHRLAPWTGRLNELPDHRRGLRGDYQTRQHERVHKQIHAAEQIRTATPAAPVPTSTAAAREAARAELAAVLAARRQRRDAR